MGNTRLETALEVIKTWANTAGIPVPDDYARRPMMTYAIDIAMQIINGGLVLKDIQDFIEDKLREQKDNKSKTYLWSLHAISRDIYAWKATREKSRIKYPAPWGWKNYVNQYGETLVWDYDKGMVIVIPPAVTEIDPIPNEFPSVKYKRLADKEAIVKRSDRIGFDRSFYLKDSALTEEETRGLEDLSNDV